LAERSLAERSLAERSLAERSLAERSLAERSLAERSLAERAPYAYESHMLWPDGSVHWISVIGEYYADTKNQSLHVRGIVEDITHRKVTENGLKLAASVFTHSREGIIITDADATIIDVNDSFSYITGYSRAEALGQKPSLLKSNRNDPGFFEKLWQDLLTKKHWYGEIWNRHKNGDDYVIMINISALLNNLGDTQSYVALFSDITATKSHQQQLEHIANYDALTGLPNRLLLADRLEQAIIQSERQGSSLALVYLDLDGFKAVNDQHGHTVGDALLITLSQRMRAMLREIDTLARIGGDEFVVVLVNLDNQQDCEPLLERLLRSAADPVIVDGLILQVSASIGVTLYPKDNVDADRLLRHADQAMYGAKQSGKNRYLYFDLIQSAALKSEQENLASIRSAMDKSEFVLHFQPKVNMKTGQVIGAEALIRWQHPEQGLLMPAAFLPLIKDHAYDIELGEWVLDAAFAQLADWQQQNFIIPVSVNIGAHHLQKECFVLGLSQRFAAYPNILAHQIELEILESSALEDLNNASNIMKSCCELGVHFALDDFGTGYSSLTYLKRLPINMLKIDQSFVRDMLIDLENLPIIEGVIGLARAFHHKVIAEGVETPAHCQRLLELGCDLAQGFAIARPMPANQLADWVKDWHQQSSWTMQ
jgi:diguanylate cyclase (GGDEF)-like protein/PAS domain S-box-containing protein